MQEGDVFSKEFEVNQDVYQGFRDIFKDQNPLHTNAEFATQKGFKNEVMYGNILNGFLSYFIGEMLPVKNVIIQTQTISYRKPVYLNDILQLEAKLITASEAVESYEFKYTFRNQENTKVANGIIQIGLI